MSFNFVFNDRFSSIQNKIILITFGGHVGNRCLSTNSSVFFSLLCSHNLLPLRHLPPHPSLAARQHHNNVKVNPMCWSWCLLFQVQRF